MFKYEKKMEYPIHISKKDLRMAKYLITQYGGPDGELAAGLRYFSQKFTMPDEKGKSVLNDIATEEFGHAEMICTMVYQLMRNATVEEMDRAGLGGHYADHNLAIYPTDATGNPFSATYFQSKGDVLADLTEDMAAEEKARATYENLIQLTDDEDVIGPLLFLRQREVIHLKRFKELHDYYKNKGY